MQFLFGSPRCLLALTKRWAPAGRRHNFANAIALGNWSNLLYIIQWTAFHVFLGRVKDRALWDFREKSGIGLVLKTRLLQVALLVGGMRGRRKEWNLFAPSLAGPSVHVREGFFQSNGR